MIDLATVFRPSADIRYRIFEGEAIVVQQEDARVMSLNPLGTCILDLLDGATPVRDLLSRLTKAYDVAPDILEADLLAYLDELWDAHVIEPVTTVQENRRHGL